MNNTERSQLNKLILSAQTESDEKGTVPKGLMTRISRRFFLLDQSDQDRVMADLDERSREAILDLDIKKARTFVLISDMIDRRYREGRTGN